MAHNPVRSEAGSVDFTLKRFFTRLFGKRKRSWLILPQRQPPRTLTLRAAPVV